MDANNLIYYWFNYDVQYLDKRHYVLDHLFFILSLLFLFFKIKDRDLSEQHLKETENFV